MYFRRIKKHLHEWREEYLLAFEVTHFMMDVIIVVHIVFMILH